MASLWLIPKKGHPFTTTVDELIAETPGNVSSKLEKHKFIPHVTVTSDIDPKKTYEADGQSPQQWLDGLQLPEFKKEVSEVVIELDHLEPGEPFFRKLVIEANHNDNLVKLAARCRRDAVIGSDDEASEKDAQNWAKTKFKPHMSILYADLLLADLKKKVPFIETQVGFSLGGLFACCGGSLAMGGLLVLVDTSKPISEWQPIAQRETPWANWRMTNNLT